MRLWRICTAFLPKLSTRRSVATGNGFRRISCWKLDAKEWEILRSQIVTLRSEHGRHRKYLPLAFTEHGAIMAATILNSTRAVQMSVYVVRAFVKARELLNSHTDLARELALLKRSVATLDADTRRQFDIVYEAILGLMSQGAKKQ